MGCEDSQNYILDRHSKEIEEMGIKSLAIQPQKAQGEDHDGFEPVISTDGILYYEYKREKFIKPECDGREYLLIKLENGLKSLVIQDTKEHKSSAALNVNIGSILDPAEFQGLAHFLEHMLFLGTEKYPKENEYSNYLSTHGGSSNAYTDTENTCYYFDVSSKFFEGALDRFAQFFISPKFTADCTEREVRAIDSEYKKNLQSDLWRLYQMEKTLLDPNHPFTKFATGTYDTLMGSAIRNKKDLREELIKFYNKYYSSDMMGLVVIGNEPVEVLKEWVVSKFSKVKSKGKTYESPKTHPLTKEHLGKIIRVKSVRDERQLIISFPFPDDQKEYTCKPTNYLASLIGHEAEGSILLVLKKYGWATELHTSNHMSFGGDFGLFKITVYLTEEGVEKYREIIKIVFKYINIVREHGPQEWFFEEMKQMSKIEFQYEEKMDSVHYSSNLSSVLTNYYCKPEEIYSSQRLITEFDPKIIQKRVELLTSTNYRATLSIKDATFTNPQIEKYYNIEYQVDDLEPELVENMEESIKGLPEDILTALYLPKPNRFIPKVLQVDKPEEIPDPRIEPELLKKNDQMELWYKRDDRFYLPRAVIRIAIMSPIMYKSPLLSVLGSLYVSMIGDQINKGTYDAIASGYRYCVSETMDGMMISVAGYNDKLWDLLKLILEGMRDFEFDEDRYKVNLREISLRYENQVHSEPFKHANGVTNFLKFDLQWRSQDKLDAIEHVSLDLLRRFVDDIFRQLYVQMLVLGNYSENEALDISEKVMKYCSSGRLSEPEYVVPRCLLHPVGVYSLQVDPQSEKNVNSAVQRTIFTSNTDSPYYKAMVDLISNIVSEPLFDQLRTKEQLGYIVSSGAFIANGAPPSLYILVQSEVNPAYVDLRISSFLRAYSPIIRSLSQAEFDHHVNSLIVRRLQNPKCINEESSRFWVQIHSKFYDFEWREVEVSILKSLTLNDLFAFWDRYFLPHPNSKASHLVVSVHSSFVRKPTTLELQKYPQSIIALQGCLAKEGLSSELCSLKSLNALILDIASHLDLVKLLPSTIDDAIPYLISWCTPLYDSNPDQLDALKSKLVSNTGPTNYLRTALYMALEEYSYINHGYDHDHDIPSNKPNGISDSSPSLSTPASLKPTIPTVSSNTGVSKYKDPKQFEDTIKAARGLTKTPSGSWVFTDAVKYKNTSVISSGPFSFHPLIPKY